jgi:hypothetical protein
MKVLVVLVLVLAVGQSAWAQCGTIEGARAAIIELARVEMRVFEETYAVRLNWEVARISTYGEALLIGIPVIAPPSGFHPGDIVAGFVVRGTPGHPDGGFGLRLGEGGAINVVNAWGQVLREMPRCDPRFGDCGPPPGTNVMPITTFSPAEGGEPTGNCCYDCYQFCHGIFPNMVCEYVCWLVCPCPDK